ncbi:hypothetical protein ACIO13_00485 [Streptomyces sp. NPDC087425]|uniref:hypothetical protein n=1 Tax=Streptomyces sp. NPDC087425 TaxID=3365787 RepID=UPI0037F225D9
MQRSLITALAGAVLSLAAIAPAAANNIRFFAYEDPAHQGVAKVVNMVDRTPQHAGEAQWGVCKELSIGRDFINDTGGTVYLYEHEGCVGSPKHRLDDTEEVVNMPTRSIKSVKVIQQ